MKINELAKKLNITARTIRFYEEKGLIKPEKNSDNLYRIFDESDIIRLQLIISLKETGISIEQIRNVLNSLDQETDSDYEKLLLYLEVHRFAIASKWLEYKSRLDTLEEMIQEVTEHKKMDIHALYALSSKVREKNEVRNSWIDLWNLDEKAEFFDEQVIVDLGELDTHKKYHQTLLRISDYITLKEGDKGLDLGIGTGNLTSLFLENGAHMTGVDVSMEMIKRCKQKYPNVNVKLGNCLALPFDSRQFDFIVCSFALRHLTQPQKELCLEEMLRVLKQNGQICMADIMFQDVKAREQFIMECEGKGEESKIRWIEEYYFTDFDFISSWFCERGFTVKGEKMDKNVFLIYARNENY